MNDEMYIQILFDRLAGKLVEYVENYHLANKSSDCDFSLQPSYPVDYTINNFDMGSTIDDWWVHKIAGCLNINDLPDDLKELTVQFLPRFYNEFPQYKNEKCLKLRHYNRS